MIKTVIISVGKLKEKATASLIAEYEKRLSKYTDFSHIEINDLALPDNPSQKEIDLVLQKEGANILKAIPKNMVKAAMTIDGTQHTSEAFAELIEKNKGNGGTVFIIGSSHGLCQQVVNVCDVKISLSKMTFPHNLARLILTEQIYRANKILANENYHK